MAATASKGILRGGEFLLRSSLPGQTFTPEDLSAEHQAIARTAADFFTREVAPSLEELLHHPGEVGPKLLRQSAALGFTAAAIPEDYGGLDLDLASALVMEEQLARDASYVLWHSAHTGIGTLPLLYFGSNAQKERYLPRLASAELIAAYALSEPQAGSDALAIRTRADLTPDGRHYLLNGQKMWITNGGAAGLFTVFAKIDGEKFSAFLVERNFEGVRTGPEEKKMGIKGSSTTPLFLDNVPVPVENLLGEPGRGHLIAFHILNIGRFKLGAMTSAASKHVLDLSLKYAAERKAFGAAIGTFGAIQHKLAEMAVRIYAVEAAVWRLAGMLEAFEGPMIRAAEEYAVECSILKVAGSETLDYVTDEAVQIHGGYGFHQDYAVERAYRDSRINRIFEGTNEINRLLIPGMLLKRAGRGQIDLTPKPMTISDCSEEATLVANAKRVALLMLETVQERFGTDVTAQQEIAMLAADIILEAFLMESAYLRTVKMGDGRECLTAPQMCAVFLRDAMDRIELAGRRILAACGSGLSRQDLQGFVSYEPLNAVLARRQIAAQLIAEGRYLV